MKLIIIENHQPLPVKQYGGIERISLFHYTAQCELGVNDPVLICLHGSSVSTPNGKVIQLSRNEMNDLLSNKLPLRNLVSDADIVLTNNSELFFPIDLSGTNAYTLNNTIQFNLIASNTLSISSDQSIIYIIYIFLLICLRFFVEYSISAFFLLGL